MLRGRPNHLALASVGVVLAAVIGVQLGRSAISEINPIHFQGPLERPQGITPPPEPAPFDPYAQPYVWSMPPPPVMANCGYDCGAAQAREPVFLVMGTSVGSDASLPYWRDATPATELRPWPPGETPGAGRRLERYMSYPVTREEAERAVAEPAQARPEPQLAAATPAETLRPPPAVAEPVVEE
jgi:hypothetical protein